MIQKNKAKTKKLNVRRVLLNLKISKNRGICKRYNKKLFVKLFLKMLRRSTLKY